MTITSRLHGPRFTAALLGLALALSAGTAAETLADDSAPALEQDIAAEVNAVWDGGAMPRALEMLDEGILRNPGSFTLLKLKGDILAASRRPLEAVRAYELILTTHPDRLDVRWAKWSVLLRSGQGDEAARELRRIADYDARNPLVHLRLAQELRKLDRLEESLVPYKQAVELAPDLLSWRLGMARARFDVLDEQGADQEVQYVLKRLRPGSPLEIPAQNLLSVIYGPQRGRRFKTGFTANVPAEQREEWASIRANAWRLFATGRYREAEPIYRRVLALNPNDASAAHQLGLMLMESDRCEEALQYFQLMSSLEPDDGDYADTVFRMGQCLVKLKRWPEALFHFQLLYDTAVEFEESTKDVRLPEGMRVLDKEKLAAWIAKVRPHVPDEAVESTPPAASGNGLSEDELYSKIAAEPLTPEKPLDTRASLMGRDSDFSRFRYVIPAGKAMRDDLPTGEHDFIPLSPGDSFPRTQPEIYLVFGLVSASYDAVPVTAQCFLERSEMNGESRPVAQDKVVLTTNDQSGYFVLTRPQTEWPAGLYRCGLFEGEKESAYTQSDEVRFRILDDPAPRASQAASTP